MHQLTVAPRPGTSLTALELTGSCGARVATSAGGTRTPAHLQLSGRPFANVAVAYKRFPWRIVK